MKNRLALLLAILGAGTLICVLLFSRDNKLQNQAQPPAAAQVADVPANAPGLSPTIETLAEVPAPAAEAPSAPKAAKPESPKPVVPKAKS